MLETVEAEVFVGQARGGATEPCLLLCRTEQGHAVTVFTKLPWQGCSVEGLAREIICNLLAADLGLLVPSAVLVDYDEDFLEALEEGGSVQRGYAARFRAARPPAFGTVQLGTEFLDFARSSGCPPQPMAEAWAFDRLILNGDRRVEKPNSLTDGERIVLIDHEKALNCTLIGILEEPPWSGEAIAHVQRAAPHVFQDRFVGSDIDLTRLHRAWRTLTPRDLERYRVAIPPTWGIDAQMVGETFTYLQSLSDNIDQAFQKLSEALL